MKIYLVGGAVRDALLGRPVREKDYVVVGATVDDMLGQKFQPVGKAFPVFLHPKTKEEYALARTEKKVAKGYHGFTFHAQPDVTLEEDLIRRDLTINAMAQDEQGHVIDPYGGQADLKNKILRHVSQAFAEDPVRILRAARFAARFDFKVAPETIALMRQMVENGEVNALVAERVWKEMQIALTEPHPELFFEVLKACGALEILFPEIRDTFYLKESLKITNNPIIRFAALTAAFDSKALDKLCRDFRIPNDYHDLAKLVCLYHDRCNQQLSAEDILNLLEKLDVFRRPERLEDFLVACEAINGKRADHLYQAYLAADSINTAEIAKGLVGPAIREAIHHARAEAIDKIHV